MLSVVSDNMYQRTGYIASSRFLVPPRQIEPPSHLRTVITGINFHYEIVAYIGSTSYHAWMYSVAVESSAVWSSLSFLE